MGSIVATLFCTDGVPAFETLKIPEPSFENLAYKVGEAFINMLAQTGSKLESHSRRLKC
jgi:hypothetical protein